MGSIPAPAGETTHSCCSTRMAAVHPRACGGNQLIVEIVRTLTGPSPRLRGKLSLADTGGPGDGSIPAPAGETSTIWCSGTTTRVHPRACGGNRAGWTVARGHSGPSPRLRGKRPLHGRARLREGSIPAPAGETRRPEARQTETQVHPRACGGNSLRPAQSMLGGRAVLGARRSRRGTPDLAVGRQRKPGVRRGCVALREMKSVVLD